MSDAAPSVSAQPLLSPAIVAVPSISLSVAPKVDEEATKDKAEQSTVSLSASAIPPSPLASSLPFAMPALFSLKYVSLALVVVQTSALVLLLRYSRVAGSDQYFSSVAVVMAELLKMVAAFLVLAYQGGSLRSAWTAVDRDIIQQRTDTLKVAVPAGIYALQNNLLFYGLSNLAVPTYQVTNQLKVLTTALFSVLMLGRVLSLRKWFALALLFVGICLVQLDAVFSTPSKAPSANPKPTVTQNPFLGALAVLCASVTSGFAGVYFEKMLKGSAVSLWTRNIQLGFFGALFGSVIAFLNDGSSIAEKGLFFAWSPLVTLVVANQALGGLLIAVVIKYADNILKGFAVSFSIILSSLLSVLFFDFSVHVYFAIGTVCVLTSSYLYEDFAQSAPQPQSSLPR